MVTRLGIILLIAISTSIHADTVTRLVSANYSGGGENRSTTASSQQIPNAVWVRTSNGRIPPNAIAVKYTNGTPEYSCRVYLGDMKFYGTIIANRGCRVKEHPQSIFSSYEVLSSDGR